MTALGQALDLSSASEYSRVRGGAGSLDKFTMARYSCIVKYKTSHYSFVLPVHLAMRLAGLAEQEVLDTAEGILLDIGHYFQVTSSVTCSSTSYLTSFWTSSSTSSLQSSSTSSLTSS